MSLNRGKIFQKVLQMNNGSSIPQIGVGCYSIKNNHIFYESLKAGYRLFDSAGFYMNEKQIGDACRQAMKDFSIKREDIFVSTKVPPNLYGKDKTLKSIERSLKLFDLEYIDMTLLLWPGGSGREQDPTEIQSLRKEAW